MEHPENNRREEFRGFAKRVWIAGGILALITIVLLLFKATISVLLLIIAGALIAIYFRGLGSLIERKTKWKSSVSLLISIFGTFILLGLIFWLIGAKAQQQITELSESLPQMVNNARKQISETSLGKKLIERISTSNSQDKVQSMASTFFTSTFGVLGDIYVVIFLGIFFTASPKLYTRGLVKMVPPAGRSKAEEVLKKLGVMLRKWLKGQLFAMLVVFILSSIGLVSLGVPMWLALAIIAGFLNFIPNFGPLIAMIPAVLVALMQGPGTAALVAGLYILVQVIEGNFITPMVQKKLVDIPPALIIIAQLLMGALTGGWGLVLATPLMVILITLIKELYIRQIENSK